ncbi:uncharacterized protein EV420DRAFT_1156069 [Desarmillaria tabescens]|uniref:DUF6533 domain-containing protein n=1 Tax=Armillaria tabescens TaxID=1929756 RepID=A0AA39NCN4_ARMTA|nr:uncharacterized protein EV420DRAFT_1156069 [Desarmillaria tabescens]KAK0463099.1 hypothetical protein EV420DRAFT_1156069 [Desarmillaria tabescens]
MSDADASAAIAAFQAFVNNLYENKKSSYSYVSALSFLTWDIIVSFGDEVNYIWVSQWSIPKLMYFLARYYPFLYLIGANIMSLATDIPKRLYVMAFTFKVYFLAPSIQLSGLLVLVFNRRSLFRDHNIGHHFASSGLFVIQPE